MTSKKTITIKKKTIPIISTITETITETIITNKEKGDLYEKYIYYHLQNLTTYKNVWLWKNIPEYELLKSQIMDDWNTARLTRKREHIENRLPDFGTDLLALETDANGHDKYSIIQCKNYNDSRTLRAEDLGTFYFMMYRYSKFVNGLVFHTNDLSTNLLNHNLTNDNIKYLKVKFEEGKYDLGNLDDNIDDEENSTVILKPHQYQIDAYNALKGKTRGILQMACGTGKTLVSIMLAKDYKQNIIIAPLKAYCEQNMMRFASQMSSDYKMLIIDSDNDGRNIENIKEFIKTNAKFCLFCTYKSIDIINEIKELKLIDDCYFIIDEFHNISYKDVYGEVEEKEEDEDFKENDDSNDETFEDDEDFEEEEESDKEDENGATEMYKLLHSDSRIMFMSATPRLFENDDFNYYEYDEDDKGARGAEALVFGEIDYTYSMSDAIEQKRVADYRIIVPTLSISKYEGIEKIYKECNLKDYDKELVVKTRYIIKGCMELGNRKCIIYLQSQAECKEMTEIINEQCKNYFAIKNYCTYIISSDLKAERAYKLKKFANFEDYSFICSVDILNECIDIPKCDSIFIAYPSKSKIRNIQRLCRANRKDAENVDKIATIFLWAEEYKTDLVDFMVHIKEFDPKLSFSKVKRLNVSSENKSLMMPDVEVKENKNLEDIVVGFKVAGNWMEKLEMVKKYIDENGKRPPFKFEKNKFIKILGKWLSHQITNFNQNLKNMKDEKIYKIFSEFINDEKYKKYFINMEEHFNINLNKLKIYINKNNKLPSTESKIKDVKYLGRWVSSQKKNYKKNMQNMKVENIYKKWNEFINDEKYKIYFQSQEENFNMNLKNFKKNIDENNKRPTEYNKDINIIILARWINTQIANYNKKQNNMKDKNIYNKWTEFINDEKYKKYFQSNYEDFIINLNKLKKYIDENNIKPSQFGSNSLIKNLSQWCCKQKNNYKNKTKNMKDEKIYNKWTEFITNEKYKKYFEDVTMEELFDIHFKKVKDYIDKNNEKPKNYDKNKDIQFLGAWINTQRNNYLNKKQNMKDKNVYNKWSEFINDEKYKKYFILPTIEENFNSNLNKVKKYIDDNNKRPSSESKIKDIKYLGKWISDQNINYKKKKFNMKYINIYNKWTEFINDEKYKTYFNN